MTLAEAVRTLPVGTRLRRHMKVSLTGVAGVVSEVRVSWMPVGYDCHTVGILSVGGISYTDAESSDWEVVSEAKR